MATTFQLETAKRGGGRLVQTHKAVLTFVAGQIGVIGYSGLTAGSGGTSGTYPLIFTGGTLATGGSAATGTFTVSGGGVTAINITSPGQYTAAPTFSFANAPGLTGASATVTAAPAAMVQYNNYSPDLASIALNARVSVIRSFTPTAISGSPTNVYIAVGASFLDQSYVANVDRKAQGSATEALVASGLVALRSVQAPIVVSGYCNGGTTPAGYIEVEIEFAASN